MTLGHIFMNIIIQGIVVLTGLLVNVSALGVSDGLERTDFLIVSIWEGVVVLKEQIFNSFLFQRVQCS